MQFLTRNRCFKNLQLLGGKKVNASDLASLRNLHYITAKYNRVGQENVY